MLVSCKGIQGHVLQIQGLKAWFEIIFKLPLVMKHKANQFNNIYRCFLKQLKNQKLKEEEFMGGHKTFTEISF